MKTTFKNLKLILTRTVLCSPLLKYVLCISIVINLTSHTYAIPSKFRLVGIGDLSTEMTLVFDTSINDGDTIEKYPKIFFDTDYNTVNNLTSTFILPDSSNTYAGMRNNICRLVNLEPNTQYYFRVADNDGSSFTYHFYTLPNNDSPLSIIAGGSSRNNRSVRISANNMVSKLKPHLIMFNGDFTDDGSALDWQAWFEDWQYIIGTDNRITPIIPARGNHERNNSELVDLFGVPANVYYTSFSNSLLTVTTLNSEVASLNHASQKDWLEQTLSQVNTTYKIVQYHKSMRPHITAKLDNSSAYTYWAKMFEDYGVDLVVESDAHTAKTTWPLAVCTGGIYCDEGFRRDDANGVVYTGEGGWGAPLRPNDDDKIWTRSSGMFNQFKWIFVHSEKLELRTVKYDNVATVSEVNLNNRFQLPAGIDINGEVTIIETSNNLPAIINEPKNNTTFFEIQPIEIAASIENTNKTIDNVSFYINGVFIGSDSTIPYRFGDWFATDYGIYILTTITNFSSGESKLTNSYFQIINSFQIVDTKINSSFDDAEELINGQMDITNSDLDLGYNDIVCGLRFQNVNIPSNATVTDCYIQFTVRTPKIDPTMLTIYGEKKATGEAFIFDSYNISSRPKTNNSISWNPDLWTFGTNGIEQRTPDLSNILNEIIALNDYSLETPFVFIIEGDGYRVADSFDGDSINAPVLHYSYEFDPSSTNNTNLSNIYPGDLNNDGIVNNQDVGLWGLFLYETGPPRTSGNQNTNWSPYPAEDWNHQQLNNEDIKHFDTNGNGVIEEDDCQAVTANFGQTWSPATAVEMPEQPTQSDQQVMLHPIDQVIDGFLVLNISLERRTNADLSVRGGYFTIDYSDIEGAIDYVTLGLSNDSWLGIRDEDLFFEIEELPVEKKIEVGFTKSNNVNSEGRGVIGQLIVAFENNGSRLSKKTNMYEFRVNTIGIHNSQELTLIEDQTLQVNIDISNNCQTNWTIGENTPFQNQYKSDNDITTNGFVVIGDEQEVLYQAGNITLNSGFSVKADADFKVEIGDCAE